MGWYATLGANTTAHTQHTVTSTLYNHSLLRGQVLAQLQSVAYVLLCTIYNVYTWAGRPHQLLLQMHTFDTGSHLHFSKVVELLASRSLSSALHNVGTWGKIPQQPLTQLQTHNAGLHCGKVIAFLN